MEESNAKKISSVKIGRDGSVRVAYEDDVEMTYQDDGMVSEAFSNAWSALRPILSRVYGLSTGLMGITGLETGESDDGHGSGSPATSPHRWFPDSVSRYPDRRCFPMRQRSHR